MSRESGSEHPSQRTVAELLAEYGGSSKRDGNSNRRRRRAEDPSETAPQAIIERVLSDNGAAYVSHLWRDTCNEPQVKHSRTRPCRPQTNGKIERFHRTLSDGWGYARLLPHRSRTPRSTGHLVPQLQPPSTPHCDRQQTTEPIARLINLPGQYT